MTASDFDRRTKKAPTIKTLARALGMSPSTVSRALNADPVVRPETIRKVMEEADAQGYRRDFRGVNLRTGRTFTLCAVLGTNPAREFGDPAAMHLIEGLIAGVEQTDFKMVIRPVERADQRLEAVREAVTNGRFDGIIIDHTEPQDQRVLYLLEHNVPFVTFGRTELFTPHAYFDIDNEDAAFVATTHLAALGHRRIALVDQPLTFMFTNHRRRGYRRGLEAAGLPFAPELMLDAPITPGHVEEAVDHLLALPDRPTGFVMANEVATIGAVAACRHLPADEFSRMRFVSRDGTNFFDFFEPAVSSCYYPLLEVGFSMANMLVKAVQGTPVAELQRLERATLVARPRAALAKGSAA